MHLNHNSDGNFTDDFTQVKLTLVREKWKYKSVNRRQVTNNFVQNIWTEETVGGAYFVYRSLIDSRRPTEHLQNM